jgi:hypothetical protein
METSRETQTNKEVAHEETKTGDEISLEDKRMEFDQEKEPLLKSPIVEIKEDSEHAECMEVDQNYHPKEDNSVKDESAAEPTDEEPERVSSPQSPEKSHQKSLAVEEEDESPQQELATHDEHKSNAEIPEPDHDPEPSKIDEEQQKPKGEVEEDAPKSPSEDSETPTTEPGRKSQQSVETEKPKIPPEEDDKLETAEAAEATGGDDKDMDVDEESLKGSQIEEDKALGGDKQMSPDPKKESQTAESQPGEMESVKEITSSPSRGQEPVTEEKG